MRYPLAALGPLIFEQAADALFLIDPDRDRFLDANAVALALAGHDGGPLLDRRPDSLFRLESGEALSAGFFRQALASSQSYSGRWRLLRRPDNAWVPVQAHLVSLRCDS